MSRKSADGEQRGIYPQLSGAFDMTEEQKQRIQARIMQRISDMAEPAAEAPGPPAGPVKKNGLLRLRFVPLAACLMLTLGGGFLFMRHMLTEPPAQMQISRPDSEIAEVTAVSTASETTQTSAGTAASSQTKTTGSTLRTETSESAADSTTVPPETTPAETMYTADDAGLQTGTDAASPKSAASASSDTAGTAEQAVPTTTTTTTTTAASTTVLTQSEAPDTIFLTAEGCSARPGETVTLRVTTKYSCTFSGIQIYLQPYCTHGAALPDFRLSTELTNTDKADIILNVQADMLTLVAVAASLNPMQIPAGTALMTVQFTVPADMPPGTVIAFPANTVCIVSGDGQTFLPAETDFGTVSVTE